MLRSFLLLLWIVTVVHAQPTSIVWMDDLPIRSFSDGIASVSINANAGGDPMKMGGVRFSRGVGMQSLNVLSFLLNGGAKAFTASVGVDDKASSNVRFTFYVIGDRKVLFEVRDMRQGDAPQKVSVDLTGIKQLGLLVKATGIGLFQSYSDWADAQFVMIGDRVPQQIPNDDEKYILTPTPSRSPRINSPRIFGATSGNPFLFTVAATGERPIDFAAEGLPEGLSIDSATGIITGKVGRKGDYTVTLKAKNALGEMAQKLRVAVGNTIALTPPMGWNGWNSWAKNIDREKVMNSAQAMVGMGFRDHGWSYVNIDDAWQGQRGGKWSEYAHLSPPFLDREGHAVFSGDNGTARFGRPTSTLGGRTIYGQKATMIEGGSRVPLIVNWPGTTPAGKVNHDLTDFSDFFPTFAQLGGAALPLGVMIDGQSFAPQIKGEAGQPREWAYVQLGAKWFVREPGFKLNEAGELFDMSDAPFTEKLVAPEADTPQSKAARSRLKNVLAELNPAGGKVDRSAGRKKAGKPQDGNKEVGE